MSSLRLTTQLQQKMVLTPQLRQRIEMLQMTSLELNEMVEQEMIANPVLEEVQSGEESQEIGDNILDQNSSGEYTETDIEPISDRSADAVSEARLDKLAEFEPTGGEIGSTNGTEPTAGEYEGDDEGPSDNADAFAEIDFGREFQDYLDPGYRTQEIEYKDD